MLENVYSAFYVELETVKSAEPPPEGVAPAAAGTKLFTVCVDDVAAATAPVPVATVAAVVAVRPLERRP